MNLFIYKSRYERERSSDEYNEIAVSDYLKNQVFDTYGDRGHDILSEYISKLTELLLDKGIITKEEFKGLLPYSAPTIEKFEGEPNGE